MQLLNLFAPPSVHDLGTAVTVVSDPEQFLGYLWVLEVRRTVQLVTTGVRKGVPSDGEALDGATVYDGASQPSSISSQTASRKPTRSDRCVTTDGAS